MDVIRELSKTWGTLPEEGKQPYRDQYAEQQKAKLAGKRVRWNADRLRSDLFSTSWTDVHATPYMQNKACHTFVFAIAQLNNVNAPL